MKQILQNIRSGKTFLEELPVPLVSKKSILIKTTHSLVSLGTEKMLVEFGKSNILKKARVQPEKVQQALDKIKTDGLLPTLEAIFSKLDQPIPLGYCNVGKVIEVGEDVSEFQVGDRVASNGPHAEVVSVPKNLAAKIPDSVDSDEAVFTIIGSIGLQGIRLLNPTIGETIIVYGLGLIGLITAQLLKINGCNVIGIDLDESKCAIAKKLGILSINSKNIDPCDYVKNYTNNIGCDGVLIAASAKSDNIISQSAKMCRKKGKIILVGVVDMSLNRSQFYEKELSIQVSCSYGPGRYDSFYEDKGLDYPLPHVRWTQKRNFETVLNSIRDFGLNVKDLISEKVELEKFNSIYEEIGSNKSIASILVYPEIDQEKYISNNLTLNKTNYTSSKGIIGIIGSGNYVSSKILPSLKNVDAKIKYISSSKGVSSTLLAKKYNIDNSTTDYKKILNDDEVDNVIIATRHDSHSKFVIESLKSKKNVFVEKPLAINNSQLQKIIKANNNSPKSILTVGYNRRFSPHSKKIKESLGVDCGPINIIANMNAGFIDKDHWVNDIDVGGGRIIGEACHMIDLCIFLTGSLVSSVCMNSMGIEFDVLTDNASIMLKFENGSNAVINYFSNGSKKYNKERVEVYANEKVWILDNFKKTTAFGVTKFKTLKTQANKGHPSQFKKFVDYCIKNGRPIIPINQIINASKASFAAIESLKNKKWIDV